MSIWNENPYTILFIIYMSDMGLLGLPAGKRYCATLIISFFKLFITIIDVLFNVWYCLNESANLIPKIKYSKFLFETLWFRTTLVFDENKWVRQESLNSIIIGCEVPNKCHPRYNRKCLLLRHTKRKCSHC